MNVAQSILDRIVKFRPMSRYEMIQLAEGQKSMMYHYYLRDLAKAELKLVGLSKNNSVCFYSGWELKFKLANGSTSNKLIEAHLKPIKDFDMDTPAGTISHPMNMVYLSPNIDYFYETYHYKWNTKWYDILTPLGKIFWHNINIEIRKTVMSRFTNELQYNTLGGKKFPPPENHLDVINESEMIIQNIINENKNVKELLPLLDDRTKILSREQLGANKLPVWYGKNPSVESVQEWRKFTISDKQKTGKGLQQSHGAFTECRHGYKKEMSAAKVKYECEMCGIDHGLNVCHDNGYKDFKSNTPLGIVNHRENVAFLCKNHDKEFEAEKNNPEYRKLFDRKHKEAVEKYPSKVYNKDNIFWECDDSVDCIDYDFKKEYKKYLKK